MKILLSLLCFVMVVSCKEGGKDSASAKADQEQSGLRLNEWLEQEFQKDLAMDPQLQTSMGSKKNYDKWTDISTERDLQKKELAQERLDYLDENFDEDDLNSEDALSYKLYHRLQEEEIENYDYRLYTYPVNQMHGMQSEVPAFLINMHQIENEEDARDYIERLKGIKGLFKTLIANLQLREANGILPPRFVFEKVIKDSRNVITGYPFEISKDLSTLAQDFTTKVEKLSMDQEVKTALIDESNKVMISHVAPAYNDLILTLEDQQQRATGEDGVWKFPKGKKYYRHALQRTTTTDLTASQIHNLGLKEVKRIHEEMRDIMKKVKFKGSLQDFFTYMKEDPQFYNTDDEDGRSKYLNTAINTINDMKEELPQLFHTLPVAGIQVKAVEKFRESSAGKAFYQQPATDGSRPGTYYANLYDMEAMPTYQLEALAYHEGIPGHHMQIAIAQELDNVPEFRKHLFYTSYVEGWALYAELLPKEIGFYKDPYSDFGRLAMELWRACRLVVDTGIHDKKWSREEAIQYYVSNTPNAESDAIKMVERHIVMPSQATAYKVGMNKIVQLREKVRKELGEKFDIKEFHDIILKNGAVPLTILEDLVEVYIDSHN